MSLAPVRVAAVTADARRGARASRELFSLRCRDAPQFYIFPYTIIDMQRNKAVLYTLCDTRANEIHVARGDARVCDVHVCACVCVAASDPSFRLFPPVLPLYWLFLLLVFRAGSRLALGAGEYIVCRYATRSAASTVHICTCTCRYAHAHTHAYAHAHARAHVHAHLYPQARASLPEPSR